eukprot:gene14939-20097_t
MKISSTLIAFAIQGNMVDFSKWSSMFDSMSLKQNVFPFFLSYDEPIPEEVCNLLSSHSKCVFYPKSTWTEGRNRLVRLVAETEDEIDSKFKYWVFGDGDLYSSTCDGFSHQRNINANISNTNNFDLNNMNILCTSTSCCYDKFITILSHKQTKFATIGFMGYRPPSEAPIIYHTYDMALFEDCHDAQLQAIHRHAVPVLLPYVELLDSLSWWESQLFLFQNAATCLSGSSVILPFFDCNNIAHKSYPRGKFRDRERAIIIQIYRKYKLINNKNEIIFQNHNHDIGTGSGLGLINNTIIIPWNYNEYDLGNRFRLFLQDGKLNDNDAHSELIMRINSREIFIVRNGTKHAFPDWDTFVGMGFSIDHVVKKTNDQMNMIPTGDPIEPF